MNKIMILYVALLGAFLSVNVNARSLSYELSFLTTTIEDSTAFGGTAIDNIFTGSFTVDSMELGAAVDDFGDTIIIDPTQLAYSFNIGDHNYAYTYDATRDYIADPDFGLGSTIFEVDGDSSGSNFEVTEIVSFIFEQPGDADAFGLDLNTALGTWSAFDDSTGFTISGTVDMEMAAVPIPAAVWLFGSGVLGLTGFRKRKQKL